MRDDCRPRNFEAPEEAQDYLTDEVVKAFCRLKGTQYGIQTASASPDGKRIRFTTTNANILDKSAKGTLEKFEYDGRLYTVRAVLPIRPRKF